MTGINLRIRHYNYKRSQHNSPYVDDPFSIHKIYIKDITLKRDMTYIDYRDMVINSVYFCTPYPLVNQRNYGKSPFLLGKSTINVPCSIAMLVYQRVFCWFQSQQSPDPFDSSQWLILIVAGYKYLSCHDYPWRIHEIAMGQNSSLM